MKRRYLPHDFIFNLCASYYSFPDSTSSQFSNSAFWEVSSNNETQSIDKCESQSNFYASDQDFNMSRTANEAECIPEFYEKSM